MLFDLLVPDDHQSRNIDQIRSTQSIDPNIRLRLFQVVSTSFLVNDIKQRLRREVT